MRHGGRKNLPNGACRGIDGAEDPLQQKEEKPEIEKRATLPVLAPRKRCDLILAVLSQVSVQCVCEYECGARASE